jgi:hypothetical protein
MAACPTVAAVAGRFNFILAAFPSQHFRQAARHPRNQIE